MTETAKKRFITTIILLILAQVLFFATFSAATPRDAYYDAEACSRSLRQNPQKIKYRHNWLRCIKKYQSVYKQDPAGPWAAAGLYKSAKMYNRLSIATQKAAIDS
jgi:N-acetylmuramoyl-L-alanine amidase